MELNYFVNYIFEFILLFVLGSLRHFSHTFSLVQDHLLKKQFWFHKVFIFQDLFTWPVYIKQVMYIYGTQIFFLQIPYVSI